MSTPPPQADPQACPCGAAEYAHCCGPLHGGAPAPTAARLMRSRYSAFALKLADYLRLSHHPQTRASANYTMLDATRWVGLTLVEQHLGGPMDAEGTVTFEARFIEAGHLGCLSERSSFTRVDGAWRYHSGTHLETPPPAKIGRNAPCPCGSNRKFKRCCDR